MADRAEREMNALALEDREKTRKDMSKRAVRLASKGMWDDAAKVNGLMVNLFPNDVESYNRLGKALSELGRNREARTAFQSVLARSPNNAIAKKNLARLAKLADAEKPKKAARRSSRGVQFLEESGKSGVAPLTKLAPPGVLRTLAPGDRVRLEAIGDALTVAMDETYVGQVEPRVGARIARLMRGGNRYDAIVTNAEDGELTVIIRETYKSPSQARVASFPIRAGADYRVYVPKAAADYGEDDARPVIKGVAPVKDWSSDDTEPGDDDVFDDSAALNMSIVDAADEDDDY